LPVNTSKLDLLKNNTRLKSKPNHFIIKQTPTLTVAMIANGLMKQLPSMNHGKPHPKERPSSLKLILQQETLFTEKKNPVRFFLKRALANLLQEPGTSHAVLEIHEEISFRFYHTLTKSNK
jgi:hypothetical protein